MKPVDYIKLKAKSIIDNDKFRNKILTHLNSITADGKIDQSDIPDFVFLVIDIYNNLDEIHIEKNDIILVITEACIMLLKEHDLVKPDQVDEIERLLRTAMKLVSINPKIKTACNRYCGCLPCFRRKK